MWLKDRAIKTTKRDTAFWRFLLFALCIGNIGLSLIITVANPTGMHFFIDFILYLFLVFLVFTISTTIIAFILSLIYIPVPRLFIGGAIFTGIVCYYILSSANVGKQFTYIITISFLILTIILGILLYLLFHQKVNYIVKTVILALPIFTFVIINNSSILVQSEIPKFSDVYDGLEVTPLTGESPANKGDYEILYFTYGNGKDKHRIEYGSNVHIVSSSVDGSAYIDHWPRKRTLFWGFDEKNLPLNGRVWMPKGEGYFPIVLISHGNHKMEYFSDGGYAYLGELLASRGFITVSLDLNFLNYSNWSRIPKKDMELRTWMIFQHLLQIETFSSTEGNPFYNKVDFNKIALIGHSRGGLASTMAVQYKDWFSEDPSLKEAEKFNIQSVIALAPTDKRVDGKIPMLYDTNYLVIHGAQDADVNSFRGERQYERVIFSGKGNHIKSSLYLAEGNHSHFNTDWGLKDNSVPTGIFLNHKDTMDGETQREITKVYVSAFLETTLLGKKEYEKLFKNYQYGMNWLPETFTLSQYENSNFKPIVSFHSSKSKDKFANGNKVEAHGFSLWDVDITEDRRHNKKGYAATVLQWEDSARYRISLSDNFIRSLPNEIDSFIISIANMSRDLKSHSEDPFIEVEFINNDGEGARVPISENMPVPPPLKVQYSKVPYFDKIMRNGKFAEEEEPVFHMYEIKLDDISRLNEKINATNITEITLYFSNGPYKVMINNIGFLLNG